MGWTAAGIDRRAMAGLSLGHFAADFAQGVLPAILVFLKPALHLSYTEVAMVVLVATVASSVAQPLFGHWSDRRRAIWLMSAGIALSAICIACATVAGNYVLLLVLVACSGFGVGAFHPEAMKVAGHASGGRRASGMALFSFGGNVGFAVGPLFASVLISSFGTNGGLLLAVPGVVIALVLVREYERFSFARLRPTSDPTTRCNADQPAAFRLLLVYIGLRSLAYYGLFTFVPLWEVAGGHSEEYGNTLLSLVLVAGVLGTLAAGPLADAAGRRFVLGASALLAPAFILAYVLVGGPIGALAVCGAGACLVGTFGVTIVLSQEYLPSRIAFASGMSVGFATGLGGVAAIALGAIADAVDLRTALVVTAIGPALAVLVTKRLPADRRMALARVR